MKKIIITIIFLITILNTSTVQALQTEEIIKEQEEELGISGFIKDAQEYTDEAFDEIDIKDIYKSALSGNIEKKRNYGWNNKNTR